MIYGILSQECLVLFYYRKLCWINNHFLIDVILFHGGSAGTLANVSYHS